MRRGRGSEGNGTRARRPGRRGRFSSRFFLLALRGGVGLLLGTACLLWAWVGLRQLGRLPAFAIAHVTVRGNAQVSTAEIVTRLGLPSGTGILEPDLTELRRRLLAHPWIQEARVSRRLPPALEVTVRERRPEVLLVGERFYLAGEDGVILAEATGAALPELPRIILSGGPYAPGERAGGEVVPRALALWRALASSPALRRERLREIRPAPDGIFTVDTERGTLLRVRGEDVERQLGRLEAALRHAGRPLRAYEVVDLRFGDRIVLRAGVQKGG